MKRAFFVISLAVLLVFIVTAATAQSVERPQLVLEPKANLKVEPAPWSHAPLVPSPITRKEQRRLVVNWEAREMKAEIAPGVIYESYWTFEGKVPGPVLRLREGDLLEINLTNNITSTQHHNIDFHFVMGPGGGASALNVAPGATAKLEVRATAPGFYMFHCATSDIPTHIANGMYGYVIVEPAEGLPPVGNEYYVVQSELYTTDGKKGKQAFSIERGDNFDAEYVVFNGAVGALMGPKALRGNLNQPVRLWVGNAGPNFISSFHVIGQIFNKVYREGDLISPPGRGIQTTLIPAGGSAVVEFTSTVPGTYLLVDHAIFRLHKGAVGAIDFAGAANAEVFDAVTAGVKGADMGDHGHAGPPAEAPAKAPAPVTAPVKKAPTTAPVRKTSAPSAQMNGGSLKTTALKTIALTGPVTSAFAGNFPQLAGGFEREADMDAEAQSAGASASAATVRMLPGAGTYDKDPTNDFSHPVVTIKAGGTVRWLNTDTVNHINKGDKGEFATPNLKPGESYSHTFKRAGTYNYVCEPHPWMKGKIVVR
ncbi:MAG: plastocyanin/azurin family copper-binding protein [Terriglobales bacterium]